MRLAPISNFFSALDKRLYPILSSVWQARSLPGTLLSCQGCFPYLSHHSHLCGVGLAGKLDRHPANCKVHLTSIRCRPCHDESRKPAPALQLQSRACRGLCLALRVHKSRACTVNGIRFFHSGSCGGYVTY